MYDMYLSNNLGVGYHVAAEVCDMGDHYSVTTKTSLAISLNKENCEVSGNNITYRDSYITVVLSQVIR